ncbi:serine hydrolase [Aquipuribacter sp. SD81]|uniref:serine hydrolase n=1 Tax=Aquipuribacter sp. SD81 TaxID=3127703 RepID=UPI003019BB96
MRPERLLAACESALLRPEHAHVVALGVSDGTRRLVAGPDPDATGDVFSVTKSVTATAVRAALADGVLASLDDPLTVLDRAPGVTVHRLLCMRQAWREDPDMDALAGTAADPLPAIGAALASGTAADGRPRYVNAAAHLLVRELDARTGSAAGYLSRRVLAPAGVGEHEWERDATGAPWGHAHLHLGIADLLLLGETWAAARPDLHPGTCALGPPVAPEHLAYGGGFWHGEDVLLAAGWGGQCVLVHLPTGTVLAALTRTGWTRESGTDTLPSGWASGRRLFEEHALPLLRGSPAGHRPADDERGTR